MNLLEETRKILERHGYRFSQIEWAVIGMDDYPVKKYRYLPPLHVERDLERFLKEIDFDYDDGFGGQYVFGKIMLVDGSWVERAEYDGSEWWEYKERVSFATAKAQLEKDMEY